MTFPLRYTDIRRPVVSSKVTIPRSDNARCRERVVSLATGARAVSARATMADGITNASFFSRRGLSIDHTV